MSSLLGYDRDETPTRSLYAFDSRREEEKFEDSTSGNSKAKSGPKPKQLITRKLDERSFVSGVTTSKHSTYMDTLPLTKGPLRTPTRTQYSEESHG